MDSQIWPIPPDTSRSGAISIVHIMKSQKSRSRGMPSQPPPGSTDRSPRTPAPFQPAPDSTGGSPLGSRRRSPPRPAPATSRDMQVTLVEWWLERVESKEGKIGVAGEACVPQMRHQSKEGKIGVAGEAYVPQMSEGAFSSKPNKARRLFRSCAIVKRLGYCTIESEDGYHIRIDGPLNISKTRENGFSEKVCECFKWDFPEQWQGLVNPKMVPDYNEHARSPAETTTAAPSPHEDVDMSIIAGFFSS
ncbi:hypothetical protein BDA96_04G193200 [Sorghum bicolor]|uniref:SANTA domain-containing protein n=2 Tax=Sorghum bicolor TaxID=4558 RepID=A0A921R535_SORBI|nr:hypothetical protein BDA96_04G193200 [Sorghum bicolor]KXG30438.1 hypothetical protein SORBI_3004G181100 [Sorghum bicolor]